MKKLILLFLLFYSFAYSQVDTANWSFLPNQTNGKFTALISRELYYGISGGQYKQMSLSATSYDSTVFQLIPNQLDGRYTMIENIATYYGKDSGTVRMNLSDNPLLTASSIGIDTSLFVKRSAFSQQITATGGDFEITATLGNMNIFVSSSKILNIGDIEKGRYIQLDDGGQTLITNSSIILQSGQSIQFQVDSGGEYGFVNMPTVAGGVFGTADGYITIKIGDGSTLIDIPYKTH